MPVLNTKSPRAIGLLLHPTSLPGTNNCGSFGDFARRWLRALSSNGIGVWQFLPLGPTDSTGSPYSSPSSFAYNPWFLDVNDLIQDGFLTPKTGELLPFESQENAYKVNFKLADIRSQRIAELLLDSWGFQSEANHDEFQSWCSKQFWLEDHVAFMELRRQYQNSPWWEWPKDFSMRKEKPLNDWRQIFDKELMSHRLLQWHLDRQWQSIRSLAKKLGILLYGDLPFYVSRDSADVWSNRKLFSVFDNGNLYLQSGVPPDYFSSTGQLWGTPTYRWSRHSQTNFKWWRKRFLRHLEQVDILRLDHFRALKAYWAVPGKSKTAQCGCWLPSPGLRLLNLLRKDCGGNLPLIAEDLGVITPDVEDLRDHFSLPGMKILQFAFDGNSENPYLPENIKGNNWAVYTGTHDNSTTFAWWNELGQDKRDDISKRFIAPRDSPCWQLIELGVRTEAKIFITTVQDLLSLDDDKRLNKPGTIEGNWSWRLEGIDASLLKLLEEYGCLGSKYRRYFQDTVKLLD